MNRTNLERLVSFLENLPENYPHFDMESYFHDPRNDLKTEREEMEYSVGLTEPTMGMVGCALGHSAAAGIDPMDWNATDWFGFAEQAYGVSREEALYAFGGEWYVMDNTPKGAAQRIRNVIAGTIPQDWTGGFQIDTSNTMSDDFLREVLTEVQTIMAEA